ncbi:MAG: SGNH/GDSL hydrolase family protein [Myxococcales bacterium]
MTLSFVAGCSDAADVGSAGGGGINAGAGGSPGTAISGASSVAGSNASAGSSLGGSANNGGGATTAGQASQGGVTSSGGAAGAGTNAGTAGTGGGAFGGAGGTAGGAGSGGRAAGGNGGAGGAAAFSPCQSNPCKVLPLGDSITFGVNDEGNGGYRGPLFAAAVAGAKKITFTGSVSNGPSMVSGQTFPKKNEGHSGWGISEVTPYSNNNAGIATMIPNPAFSSGSGGTPEIILLHIGTNDSGSFTAAQMQTDLKGLLDKLFTNAPNALVVLAQIIPLGYDPNNAVIKAYNQSLPGIVQDRAGAGKHIVLVDMSTGYSVGTMFGSDNIHPNTAGYKFMADKWYAAISSLLPQ